jgi:intein/homing endonuclease
MTQFSPDEIEKLLRHRETIGKFHQYLREQTKYPHPGQWKVILALLKDKKNRLFIQCGRKFGKLLPLDVEIPTPDRGFVSMGELKEGDKVFGVDGNPYPITHLFEIEENPILYRITFSDGTTLDACKDHQWLTKTKRVRKSNVRNLSPRSRYKKLTSEVITTEEIKNTLMAGKEYNHSIEIAAPISLPEKPLPIAPYTLGAWLGDGCQASPLVSGVDEEVFLKIEADGYTITRSPEFQRIYIRDFSPVLREQSLLKNKHIPEEYFWASPSQRLELLKGLMDTDGYISKKGDCYFYNTNKNLADGVDRLVCSLGGQVKRGSKIGKIKGTSYRECFIVSFRPPFSCFHISRKANLFKPRKKPNHRFITKVEPIESRPGRCISVDSPGNLYLAGKSMIPTHNSFCALYVAWRFALENPKSLVYIVAPTRVQAGDIYWQPRRLQEFGPSDFLDDSLKSEFTIYFKNGSQIALVGADKQTKRGTTPDLMIYDETRDIDEEFDNAMRPNLGAKNASFLSFSTPPDKECHYTRMRDYWLYQVDKQNEKYFYMEAPTEDNPIIDREFLREERERLEKTGRLAEYEREYMGKYIPGGAAAVLPMWNDYKQKIIKPHSLIMKMLDGNRKKWDFYSISDPAQSCFAVLFMAHNPYTSQLLFLDEIYEQERIKTHTSRIWPVIAKKAESLHAQHWSHYYDPAESWFQTSVYDLFDVSLFSVKKRGAKSPERVSLLKDVITTPNTLFISDRCKNLDSEWSNWCYKEDGSLPDKFDHLCLDGETKVVTPSGIYKIKDMPEEGEVLTEKGVKKYHSCGLIKKQVPTIKLTFSDGSFIISTPDHKFLTPTGWSRACELKRDVVMAIYDYSSLREDSRVFREEILSLWKVLSKSWEKITSSCLGALQWEYPKRIPCSSYRWKSGEQYSRKSNSSYPWGAYTSAYDRREKGSFKKEDARGSYSSGYRLAENRRSESEIQRVGEKEKGDSPSKGLERVLDLFKRVFNFGKEAWEVLLSKLQSQRSKKRFSKVELHKAIVKAEDAGLRDVYCMTVPETSSFVLSNGVISHNCDCAFYALEITSFSVRPEVSKEDIPKEDGDEFKEEESSLTFEDFMKDLIVQEDPFYFMDKP